MNENLPSGQISQVIAAWPFMNQGQKWSAKQLVINARELGMAGVELLSIEHWHLLADAGLICAATKSHTFVRGMNNVNHHKECLHKLDQAIEATSSAGFPNVMTFTGLLDTTGEENGSVVDPEEGLKNCIEGYKKIVGNAEKKDVTLILEPLNSKKTEAMKGHPGYQGDHISECLEIIRAVGSPALKLLFDVYHIQIMEGDIISNINQHFEYIGHVQIAGVPGRGEVDHNQEINYRAVMQSLLANNYQGYVGHEWIPTRDPMTGLKEAIAICDV